MEFELKEIRIKEFKKHLYKYYKQLFPKEERKPYMVIKNNVKKGNMQILGIKDKNEYQGFMIITFTKDKQIIYLEYLAILPKYQSKGLGGKSLELLALKYKEKQGIYLEIEKVGEALTKEENEIRKKRQKFYEKNNFEKLEFDIELFGHKFTPYFLKGENLKNSPSLEILNKIKETYEQTMGKKIANKFFKILN